MEVWYCVPEIGQSAPPSEEAVRGHVTSRVARFPPGTELGEVVSKISSDVGGGHVQCFLLHAVGWKRIKEDQLGTRISAGERLHLKVLADERRDLEAFSPISQYAFELSRAKVERGVLRIPSGFLGARENSALWIHPNYELLEEFIESSEWRNVHVVATPGVGNSYFGHLWLFWQAQRKSKVVYRIKRGEVNWFYYFDFSLEKPLVWISNFYDGVVGWDMREVWLIVDGPSRKQPHPGRTLQLAPPYRDAYYSFSKDTGIVCHLEAWSLQELDQCNEALDLGFGRNELKARFEVCGGLPGLVLDDKLSLEDLERRVQAAVAEVTDWESAVCCDGFSDEIKDRGLQALVHHRLVRDSGRKLLTRVELVFGSDYIASQVFESMMSKDGAKGVRRFLRFCKDRCSIAALGKKLRRMLKSTTKV